jgi:hypothetical protein
MPSHLLQEIMHSLQLQTGTPPYARPPLELVQECDSKGLSFEDFSSLLKSVINSKHVQLSSKCIRLLVPRQKLTSKELTLLMGLYSKTNSNQLRLKVLKFFSTAFDAKTLSLTGLDCLRSGYAIIFHFLNVDLLRDETCRVLYRLTRQIDVTTFRCREISKVLSRTGVGGSSATSSVLALAELYDSFRPHVIQFPPRENGLTGSSGLSRKAKLAMHTRVARLTDLKWATSLKTHAADEEDGEEDDEKFVQERQYPTKKPKIVTNLLENSSSSEPQGNILISDVFALSRAALIEQDPQQELDSDLQQSLIAHLLTWDGISSQDETFEVLSKLSFPSKPEQLPFEKSVIFPMLDLFSTCSVVFKFRASKAISKLLSHWIVTEENCSTFVQRIISLMDDYFIAALAFEKDDPLVQLACVEFFTVVGRALLGRTKVFSTSTSAAIPPSENLALRLLLSPSPVGLSTACTVMDSLFPVFRLENVAGIHTNSAMKVQTAQHFQQLAQDFVKVLVLGSALRPFEEILKFSREDRSLAEDIGELNGTELGITRSFAFAGLWMRFWEERDEVPESDPSEERLGSFLRWLQDKTPGVPSLVSNLVFKYNRMLANNEVV